MAASMTRQRMAGNNLPVPTFNLADFTFIKRADLRDPQHRFTLAQPASVDTLVAEASTLGNFRLGQLWSDACDAGIEITSHLTGRAERFYLERQIVRGGELCGWELAPVNSDCRIKKVVIFND